VYKTLQCRNRFADLFAKGNYLAAAVSGKHADQVVAFVRTHQDASVLVVAPRFPTRLVSEGQWPTGEEVWEETALSLPGEGEGKEWQDIFTGERVRTSDRVSLAQLLTRFPVAVLTSGNV
jgi:(1->4)-alpha-D-glucan 1-alpha-D-glucosylmutase